MGKPAGRPPQPLTGPRAEALEMLRKAGLPEPKKMLGLSLAMQIVACKDAAARRILMGKKRTGE